MISVSHAQQTLCAGVEIVDGFMRSHGFLYTPTTAGKSSGGLFAAGEFRRANRTLELHYRDSLDLVTYRVGRLALSHEDYMWSVLGRRLASDYPGFSKRIAGRVRASSAGFEAELRGFSCGVRRRFRTTRRAGGIPEKSCASSGVRQTAPWAFFTRDDLARNEKIRITSTAPSLTRYTAT